MNPKPPDEREQREEPEVIICRPTDPESVQRELDREFPSLEELDQQIES
jgi:hypothetical protein